MKIDYVCIYIFDQFFKISSLDNGIYILFSNLLSYFQVYSTLFSVIFTSIFYNFKLLSNFVIYLVYDLFYYKFLNI